MKRKHLAVRVEEGLHKIIMKMLIDNEETFQNYVTQLIIKDLKEKNKI